MKVRVGSSSSISWVRGTPPGECGSCSWSRDGDGEGVRVSLDGSSKTGSWMGRAGSSGDVNSLVTVGGRYGDSGVVVSTSGVAVDGRFSSVSGCFWLCVLLLGRTISSALSMSVVWAGLYGRYSSGSSFCDIGSASSEIAAAE